jgi:hypothetical protein
VPLNGDWSLWTNFKYPLMRLLVQSLEPPQEAYFDLLSISTREFVDLSSQLFSGIGDPYWLCIRTVDMGSI